MTEYLFVLGRDAELSKLELKSVFEKEFKHESSKCVIIELDKAPNVMNFGGIIKVGIIEDIAYLGENNTFFWGISDYDKNGEADFLRKDLQKKFKKEGLKAVFKKDAERPSVVCKLGLFDVILCDGFIARTVSCFDPSEIIQREKSKPETDFLISSSVRLARIMINLSKAKKDEILLDPFCGVGTILQEGLLKGLKVIGIESDAETAKKCKRNLHWLKRTGWEVFKNNSRNLSKVVISCDVCVTEPFMGPFLDNIPTRKQAFRTKVNLDSLYESIFSEIYEVLKPEGLFVFVMPSFRTNKNEIIKLSFNHKFKEIARVPFNVSSSRIVREVVVFKNTKGYKS